ncbi:Glycosyltransferase involved in cell wall bisynthesis [Roseospirillum parvum]|uniref:Glycosyltransferase involved in cell wall bisynthesis n=1 Tax=Roseospirillum parvum TaxID=83401 RepID=A0A1G7UWC8_9PROT|nr:Glycosyltransferase involved in cell wall bisynthesis [Roseospirillum parvum]
MVTITPETFRTVPCPTYPEIRLALKPRRKMAETIERFRPCVVHIATEGPLGLAARGYCQAVQVPFTTAFHTKFPEYINARFRVPVGLGYRLMRWFHGPSKAVMVATQTVEDELHRHGITHTRRWTRGVDTDLFRPRDKAALDLPHLADLPRPILLSVGRVAVEKNISAFLDLDVPGSKVVVGDGPQLEELRRRHPGVRFVGARQGEDLAAHFAYADAFVFPSLTDTFGLVLLEALASGVPVAAFPVPGPLDVIGSAPVGCLDKDLKVAVEKALSADPKACRAHAETFSWEASVDQFLSNVFPFDPAVLDAAPGTAAPAKVARPMSQQPG